MYMCNYSAPLHFGYENHYIHEIMKGIMHMNSCIAFYQGKQLDG